jgi:hypothetical protein
VKRYLFVINKNIIAKMSITIRGRSGCVLFIKSEAGTKSAGPVVIFVSNLVSNVE